MGIILAKFIELLKNAENLHNFRSSHVCFLRQDGGALYMIPSGYSSKTQQLLAYLIKNHHQVSITSLMKLSYIIDLVSVNETGDTISNFEYMRYHYGPFNPQIYHYIDCLRDEGVLRERLEYTDYGAEFVVFEYTGEDDSFDKLNEAEIGIIDVTLKKLRGYGSAALTDLAYNTKPMRKLGAELGNDKGLNEKLDLEAE